MKFRKKPVIVDAMLLTFETQLEVKQWCGGVSWSRPPMRAITGLTIPPTPSQDTLNVPFGDWIIKDSSRFISCSPDDFAEMYESID